jgi:hypothetical protein
VAVFCAPFSIAYLVLESLPFLHGHSRGQIPGRDFINTWSGARLLNEGRVFQIFDPASYSQSLANLWGHGLAQHSYSYAPNLLVLTGWLGWLPYGGALLAWSVLGLIALLAAAWPYSRRPGVAAMILCSPAVAVCLDAGQNGLFTGALILGGLRLGDRRPWLAGALIGLATVKPQLGLLIPIALLAAARWKVIASASLTAIGLVAASLPLVGVEGWRLYISRTLPFQRQLLEHSSGFWTLMTPSPLVNLGLAGASIGMSTILQSVAALIATVLVVWRFAQLNRQRRQIGASEVLLLAAATFVAAPYSFNYDMPVLAAALVCVNGERLPLTERTSWRIGVWLLWTAPLAIIVAAIDEIIFHARWLPGPSLIMAAGLAAAWKISQPLRASSDRLQATVPVGA